MTNNSGTPPRDDPSTKATGEQASQRSEERSEAGVEPNVDVLVVGAGIVGLFCAYFLARAGRSVTVVERGVVGDARSCSYGNTGFVAHGGMPLAGPGALTRGLRSYLRPDGRLAIGPWADRDTLAWLRHFRRLCNERDAALSRKVIFDLKNRSLDLLGQMCRTGPLASAFSASGMVIAFKTPQGFDQACGALPRLVESGAPIRVLHERELAALEPGVTFDISGALYNEGAGCLHAPDFVIELANTVRSLGVQIREDAEVVGFGVADGKVVEVRTTGGDFSPAETVLAAGTWSAGCAAQLGVKLPVQPIKGYSVTVKAAGQAPSRPVLLSEGTVAMRPIGDRLRLAGSLLLSGNRSVSTRRVEAMLRTAESHFPEIRFSGDREVWTGLRPCAPDSLPFLGRPRRYSNLTVACGHGHVGMGLAPATGKLVAQIVSGEQPDMNITPFAVDRFAGVA